MLFLSILDPKQTDHLFCCKPEKPGLEGEFIRLSGSYDERFGKLIALNSEGHAVYVTVNATDLKARKRENLTGIRGVWCEADDDRKRDFAIPPTMIVETSPGKFHFYWLLSDFISPEVFAEVMRCMVERYGSDPQAKDLMRPLRVPGFAHWKSGEPFTTRLIHPTGPNDPVRRYTAKELEEAFRPSPRPTLNDDWSVIDGESDWEPERIREALEHISANGREEWLGVGMAIHHASHGSNDGFDLWDTWSQRTTKGNYDARIQRLTWRGFRRHPKPITVASIYAMAKAGGWVEPPVPNPTFVFEGEFPLTERAMERLREQFDRRGHYPSEDQYRGLRCICQIIELQARGECPPKLFLSAVSTGIGKTSAVCEMVRQILQSDRYQGVAIIIFVFQLSEIRRLIDDMELSPDEFCCVTSDLSINQLGAAKASEAKVLFTTQQQLMKQASGSAKLFSELTRFSYQGKPRQVRVWDEMIDPAKTMCLSQDCLPSIKSELRRSRKKDIARVVEDLYIELRDRQTGERITMPDIQSFMSEQEYVACFTKRVLNDAQLLWDISGREVRIRVDEWNGVVSLDYQDVLPPDLNPLLVLDASGRLKRTYRLWEEYRGSFEELYSKPKTYRNLPILYCPHAAGRDPLSKLPEVEVIAEGVSEEINQIDETEQILVIARDVAIDGHDGNLFSEIKRRLTNPERVSFLHYGPHTARNDYRDYRIAFIIGALVYPSSEYEALGRGAMASRIDEEFPEAELQRIRDGEIMHHFFQAAGRIAIRKALGDDCPEGCRLYVMYTNRGPGRPSTDILNRAFPGATIREWNPISRKLSNTAEKLVMFLESRLTEREVEFTSAELVRIVTNRQNLRNALSNKGFLDWLRGLGYAMRMPHGRVVFTRWFEGRNWARQKQLYLGEVVPASY